MAGMGSRGRSLVLGVVAVVALLAAASGQAAKTAGVVWSSSSYPYGTLDAALGNTGLQTFTLRNSDGKPTGTLTVGLTASASFSITDNGCDGKRLSKKTTCTVTVEYAPTANGDDSATLTASAPNTTGANVSLSGASAWQADDLFINTQASWGSGGSAASLLTAHYNSVYFLAGGLFDIGDTSKYTIEFDSALALEAYLPQSGAPGVLVTSLLDTTVSPAGSFGGNVAALKLNVDFADADLLTANTGLKFGDLTICGLTGGDAALNGTTVRDFLATANTVLGAASTSYTGSDLDGIATPLNSSFSGGSPTTWAQDHLQPGACP
jgi:hypothetical protein